MVHSFNLVRNANGNVTIKFKENDKSRKIIFSKNTKALEELQEKLEPWGNRDVDSSQLKLYIQHLKFHYTFKANPNNVSIFRPM